MFLRRCFGGLETVWISYLYHCMCLRFASAEQTVRQKHICKEVLKENFHKTNEEVEKME